MPLAFADMGVSKVITNFAGKDEVKRHLQDLGFTRGEEVKVLSQNGSGFIVLVKGVRIALDRSLAGKIMVN